MRQISRSRLNTPWSEVGKKQEQKVNLDVNKIMSGVLSLLMSEPSCSAPALCTCTLVRKRQGIAEIIQIGGWSREREGRKREAVLLSVRQVIPR